MIAPDLPGHGGTRSGSAGRSGLDQISEDICTLVEEMDQRPQITIGHSAGAAIALNADRRLSPRGHVLINAALSEFEGLAGWIFPAMAKGLAAAPFAAELLSKNLRRKEKLASLLETTGSAISPDIAARYQALASNPAHVKGTLRMMASWDLRPLQARLGSVVTPVLLIAGEQDGTVPAEVSKKAEKTLKNARLIVHQGGHLLHEEDCDSVADDIVGFLRDLDLTDQDQSA